MKKIFSKIKVSYLLNILPIVLLAVLLIMYYVFENTKNKVIQTNYDANIKYVNSITSNIEEFIKYRTKKDIYQSLERNELLREYLEKNLQLFITAKYKYIYLVDKKSLDSNKFRFLLDGTKDEEDRSDFCETFEPMQLKIWNSIYKTKRPVYFEHKKIKSLWITYLKPIIIEDRVVAIIVVDFSIKEHNIIVSSLQELDETFENVIVFFIFIFLVMVWQIIMICFTTMLLEIIEIYFLK